LNILKIEKKIVTKKNRLRPTNSEVMDLLSNNNLAKKILKWKPKYKGRKGLKMALEKTIKWYCSEENIKLFNSKDYVI
jgi:dTDP-glucose 4,6-dehydratase